MEITSDDLECLWAVARRSPLRDKLIAGRYRRLQEQGFIMMQGDWPRLTPYGWAALDEASVDLFAAAKPVPPPP